MNCKARLKALERQKQACGEVMRFIIGRAAADGVNLAASTCIRRVAPNGVLMEVVTLDGDDSLSDEELESFIAQFPITTD
jgi:hypothetical protein